MSDYEKKLDDNFSIILTTNCHTIIYDDNSMMIYNSDLINIVDVIGTTYKPYLDKLSENDRSNLKIYYPYLLTIYQKIHIRIKGSQELLFNEQWESTLLSTVDSNYFKQIDKENRNNYNYIIDNNYIKKIKK